MQPRDEVLNWCELDFWSFNDIARFREVKWNFYSQKKINLKHFTKYSVETNPKLGTAKLFNTNQSEPTEKLSEKKTRIQP